MLARLLRESLPRLSALVLLGLAGLLAAPSAEAQIYPKSAPPGSAFVRIFNGTSATGIDGYIGTARQSALPPYTGGPFNFVPPGPTRVTVGTHTDTYTLEADHFYSVVETVDGPKLFDLKGFQSQLKAMIVVFNLMRDTSLSLKTLDGKGTVFDSIGPYKGVQREVNPVTVPLALYVDDKKLIDLPPQSFERGKVSSLTVSGTVASPIVSWGDSQSP